MAKDYINNKSVASGWNNLAALLAADGYTGTVALHSVTITNPVGSAITVKLRQTDTSGTQPGSTDGFTLPAGYGQTLEKRGAGYISASTLWIYASGAGSVDIAALSLD